MDPKCIPLQLEELHVGSNQITELCDLSQFSCLSELGLSGNKLESLAGQNLPACVEKVVVYDNQIRQVGDCSHLTQLTRLDLQDNPIASIHPNNKDFRVWWISHLSEEFFQSSQGYDSLVAGGFSTVWSLGYLQQPPREVFDRGYSAVKGYYRDASLARKLLQSRKR